MLVCSQKEGETRAAPIHRHRVNGFSQLNKAGIYLLMCRHVYVYLYDCFM